VHLLLDPYFESEKEFLTWLNREFEVPSQCTTDSLRELKDNLKNNLFEAGVEQGKIVCLVVDEGQKITLPCLEVLRELLNYETNNSKLLQIVIFGQAEMRDNLRAMPNLTDRIYNTLTLAPFSFKDTMGLIRARLELCGGAEKPAPLFTFAAFLAIYLASRGYPRQIVQLCHKVLLQVIALGLTQAGWGMVWSCTDRGVSPVVRYKIDLVLLSLSGLAAGWLLASTEPVRSILARALGMWLTMPGGLG
jgi:general secretion pathway protein A